MGSLYYSIGGRRISDVTVIDDLGITLKKQLSFERHINKKINKANSLAGMMRRLFGYLDKLILAFII